MTLDEPATAGEPDLATLRRVYGQTLAALDQLARDSEPANADDAAAIDRRLGPLLAALDRHHRWEENWLWPRLRMADAPAAAVLDELQSDHDALDLLVDQVADTRRPLALRAPILRELHTRLGVHHDRTQRDTARLIRQHFGDHEWQLASRPVADCLDRAVRDATGGRDRIGRF